MLVRVYHRWRLIISRATPQVRKPALVGLAALFLLGLLTLLGLSRTVNPFTLPSTLQDNQAISFHVWGLKQRSLLMVLPIGAFLVVLARSFVGLKAFGLFTPMLIALAFLQMGPILGPFILLSSIGVGMAVAPQLLKLRMTRVGFLGVLISFVVFVLAAAQQLLDKDISVDAFPVVVTALCVERWWKQWEMDGPWESAKIALNTLLLALVIQFVMVSHVALILIDISPLVLPTLAGAAIAILGRYRGLRMTELARFAPIWLEERRNARYPKPPAQEDDGPLPEALAALLAPGSANALDFAAAEERPGQENAGEPWSQVRRPDAGLSSPDTERDPWDQHEECDNSEIQLAYRNRPRPGQSRYESRADRARRSHDGNDLRYLRVWSTS